jgi:hypothetical protein
MTQSAIANPQSAIRPPTYPARPVNGGPLPKALPKSNGPGGSPWYYEPKLNDWRGLLHRETGALFNRRLEPLSIAGQFANATEILSDAINDPALDWLDVMCLGRRIPLGKGSLVLLDAPLAPGDWTARQERLHQLVDAGAAQPWAHEQFLPPENAVLSFAYRYEDEACQRAQGATVIDPDLFPAAAWPRLQAINKQIGHTLFEGLVAKRTDSPYPRQLRNPELDFPFWVKHRWAF